MKKRNTQSRTSKQARNPKKTRLFEMTTTTQNVAFNKNTVSLNTFYDH